MRLRIGGDAIPNPTPSLPIYPGFGRHPSTEKRMTRKHFERIAETIRELKVDEATRKDIAERFATNLRPFNDNFNRARFVRACAGEG
jgi:hypothetical protein